MSREMGEAPATITEATLFGSLAARLAAPAEPGAVVLHWLGQAGFVVTGGGHRMVIDPYLSDSLGAKYRHTATPHERMMPPPLAPGELGALDLVLVTHQHTDHMDPETLAPLAAAQPRLRFVVPAASEAEARRRIGVGAERLILLDAGEEDEPLAGFRVRAVRAAHETLDTDAEGRHRFLGYALRFAPAGGRPLTILHSGDTVPFAGQVAELAGLRPDLMLLPVNGRSAALRARGVPGNLTLEEAVELGAAVGAPAVVAHHHGMFAFNTRPLAEIEAHAARPGLPVRLVVARPRLELRVALV